MNLPVKMDSVFQVSFQKLIGCSVRSFRGVRIAVPCPAEQSDTAEDNRIGKYTEKEM